MAKDISGYQLTLGLDKSMPMEQFWGWYKVGAIKGGGGSLDQKVASTLRSSCGSSWERACGIIICKPCRTISNTTTMILWIYSGSEFSSKLSASMRCTTYTSTYPHLYEGQVVRWWILGRPWQIILWAWYLCC